MTTENRIRIAILRLRRDLIAKPGARASISAVARMANIHPSTLHTRYPGLCDEIRSLTGKPAMPKAGPSSAGIATQNEVRELKRILAEQSSRYAAALLELRSTRDELNALRLKCPSDDINVQSING